MSFNIASVQEAENLNFIASPLQPRPSWKRVVLVGIYSAKSECDPIRSRFQTGILECKYKPVCYRSAASIIKSDFVQIYV